jgi:menaquinone-dependent protoporphyrinogen IX oxidase
LTADYLGAPPGFALPFKPLRLLIAYDDTRGMCGAVVPRMRQMLEERAFQVDTHVIGSGAVDLEPYAGVIVGAPVLRLGLRPASVPEAVVTFLAGLEGLDEKKAAVFSVFTASPGTMVEALQEKLAEHGAEVVARYAYWRLKPDWGEHVVPAECMIRIR